MLFDYMVVGRAACASSATLKESESKASKTISTPISAAVAGEFALSAVQMIEFLLLGQIVWAGHY
jgi:hypothetical protein